MLSVPMRTFPGLFVGRRTVLQAEIPAERAQDKMRFVCGACEEAIYSAEDRSFLTDAVIRCRCGEFNQL